MLNCPRLSVSRLSVRRSRTLSDPFCSDTFPFVRFNPRPQPIQTQTCRTGIHDRVTTTCASILFDCRRVHYRVEDVHTSSATSTPPCEGVRDDVQNRVHAFFKPPARKRPHTFSNDIRQTRDLFFRLSSSIFFSSHSHHDNFPSFDPLRSLLIP